METILTRLAGDLSPRVHPARESPAGAGMTFSIFKSLQITYTKRLRGFMNLNPKNAVERNSP